jgi:Protein of unknown function (DUF3108)
MRRLVVSFCASVAIAAVCLGAEKAATAAAPAARDESLRYAINWPSGLSMGESQLVTHRVAVEGQPEHGDYQFTLDANVPGYPVHDQYHAISSAEYCSATVEKSYVHGRRTSNEKLSFDSHKNTVTRETVNGGKSDISTWACAKDPLTYLQYLRHELSQGRLPPPQGVVFGAVYQIRVEYAGTQTIKVADQQVEAEKLNASLKGPSTDVTFEMFFAKDSARTPLRVRVPLPLATFSMELVR